MDAATRGLVWQRAGDLCEYCRIPQEAMPLIPFHVEHIVAQMTLRRDVTAAQVPTPPGFTDAS